MIKKPVQQNVFPRSEPTPGLGLAFVERSLQGDKAWEERHAADDTDSTPPIFLSEAGKCARQIGYRLAGYPKPPMDDGGRHVTEIGNAMHSWAQQKFDREQTEVPVRVTDRDGNVWLVGRVDLIHNDEVIDFKSAGNYTFKKKLTDEGPDISNILQVSLAMDALEFDKGRVVYWAKQQLQANDTKSLGLSMDSPLRFAVEFPFEFEQVEEITTFERKRLRLIWDTVDELGDLPPRAIPYVMPQGARIVDPSTGAWALYHNDGNGGPDVLMETGSFWLCNYCPYQELCAADVEGDNAIETAVNLGRND